MSDITFAGWGAFDKNASKGELKRFTYKPKTWEETDVDIKVLYCVNETAIRVGSEIKHFKVGQLVGIGAQCQSCLKCDYCKAGNEPCCVHGHTSSRGLNYVYSAAQGEKTMGGFADCKRSPAHFAFPIPDGVDTAAAAPMLCGEFTVYALLFQNGAGTTAKDVDIVIIGGLGHFAILFAKAMGANVTAISHSENKKADAEQMGADRFIATHSGKDDDFAPCKRSLDFILCTSNNTRMPLAGYLSLLRPGGTLIMVGVPEGSLDLPVFPLIMGNVHVGGSATGSPAKIKEMFELAVKVNVKPWIQKRRMERINEVISDMEAGKPEYRYVLVHEANGGKF